MDLAAGCPRCTCPVAESVIGGERAWMCEEHGRVPPLWRPPEATYEALAEHLRTCHGAASFVPWPLPPVWAISDFGCVGAPGGAAHAGMVSCSGLSDADGPVEVTIVSEEPGVGLGARCAGLDHTDPGADIGDGPPQARVEVDGVTLPLWSVPTYATAHGPGAGDPVLDRSVFAGEARGRWLWLVLRPASAALMLQDEWLLMDLSTLGPALVDLPFGGSPPRW